MHEFSIALSIVEIVDKYAEKAGASVVNEIEIEVGELSGVVLEAMEFAMESAIKGTKAENANVVIHFLKGRGQCLYCKMEFDLQNLFDPCPFCGSFNPEVKQGKELRVKAINVD